MYLKYEYFAVSVSGSNISTNTMNGDGKRDPAVSVVIRGSDLRTLELLNHDRAHTCTWLLASPRENSVPSLHSTCFSS